MAGIGKYKKGAKFTLKSGNSPAFKMMGNIEAGDSPITNEFGIGKGVSPYKEVVPTTSYLPIEDETQEEPETQEEMKARIEAQEASNILSEKAKTTKGTTEYKAEQERIKKEEKIQAEADKKARPGKILKKAGGTLLAGALGGLERVYGGKTTDVPQVKFADKKEEVEEESISEKVDKLIK